NCGWEGGQRTMPTDTPTGSTSGRFPLGMLSAKPAATRSASTPTTSTSHPAAEGGAGTYLVNDVLYSLAGEGVRAGCPSVFLRLARCNLRCDGQVVGQAYQPVCDTEFESHRPMTADEVVAAVREAGGPCEWVVLTGGEP